MLAPDIAPSPLPTYADVQAAAQRLEGQIRLTPVLQDAKLDALGGAKFHLKAENLQETGSFKLRGALNRLLQIPLADRDRGVVAFSSGNHAQGIARAAKRLGMPALIVMPSDAPRIKTEAVLADGAEVHVYDRDTQDRVAIAREIAQARGAVLVPAYDDPHIIAGQGTCGLEFAAQVSEKLDHLICCTGGGGLISGIALAFCEASPHTQIWTAEPSGHEDWKRSLSAGQMLENAPGTRSICDALLAPQPGDIPFALSRNRLAGGLSVSDTQVMEAMRLAFAHLKLVLEPGGAVALAAALFALPAQARGQTVGVILSGGNVDKALFAGVLAG